MSSQEQDVPIKQSPSGEAGKQETYKQEGSEQQQSQQSSDVQREGGEKKSEEMKQREEKSKQPGEMRSEKKEATRESSQKPESSEKCECQDPTIEFFNRLVTKEKHCFLGKTGIKLSRISLGTMNFGKIDPEYGDRPQQLDEAQAHKILDKFAELGGNCIDTADFYPWFGKSCGESERIIGNWLHNRQHERDKFFITTKVRLPVEEDNVNSGGLSRAHIIESVNRSIKRLRTNHIDLLLLNGWDETVSIMETVRTLDDLVKVGRIRYFGACDFKGWQLQKFIDASRILNAHKCVCYEGEYNLLTRGVEWEIAEVCRNERIGFFAYSPFKYGFLTSCYHKHSEKPEEGSRIESASKNRPNIAAMAEPFEEMIKNPLYTNLLEVCEKIGKNREMSTSQVALLWLLQRGFVTSVIVGVNNVEQLEESFKILTTDCSLSFDEMCELNEASSLKLQYPYHTLLPTVAGYKTLQVPESVTFEQMSILTDRFSLEEQKKYLRRHFHETWHESKEQNLPEQSIKGEMKGYEVHPEPVREE